jgi:signal peptidase I
VSERPDVLPRTRIWQLALVLNVVFPPAGYAYVGAWRAAAVFAAVFVAGLVGLTEWTIAAPPGMYGLGLPGVIVLALSVAVALGIHAAWMSEDAPPRSGSRVRHAVTYMATSVGVLTVAQLFHAFWPHTFYSYPSAAMAPTLREGDILAVDGARARCDGPEPRVGDVVLYRRDGRPEVFVDRLVAGPGQTVEMRDGQLIVDGRPVVRNGVGQEAVEFRPRPATVIEETLPGGARYRTLDQGPGGTLDTVPPTRVPDGAWYGLGDNRDNSADSRVNGPVARRNICGSVFRIVSSQDKSHVGAKP